MENAAAPEKAEWIVRLIAEIVDNTAWSVAFLPAAIGVTLGFAVGGPVGVALGLIGLAVTGGALVWVASMYQNGQSVGKRIMGTQVVSAVDGRPLSWAANLIVRGILVKGLVVGIASQLTIGIFVLVNYLWPLWDANKQAVHDKMMSTYVVRLRTADSPSPFVF